LHLRLKTARHRHNGHRALAEAARNVQIDLIKTGAGQSDESRRDGNIIDVKADWIDNWR
jgi:hypothetical protein